MPKLSKKSTSFVVLLALAIVPAGCSAKSGSGASSSPTTSQSSAGPACGPATINGAKVHTWCGPGTVEIKVNGAKMTLTSAVCDTALAPDKLAISAGTTVDGQGEAAKVSTANGFSMFILGVTPTKDGTYTNAVFGGNNGGTEFVADQQTRKTVFITNGGMAGSFAGLDNAGATVTGTFTCG